MLKRFGVAVFCGALSMSTALFANAETIELDQNLLNELGINSASINTLKNHRVIKSYIDAISPEVSETVSENPLTDYETYIPHATQPKISAFEKAVLTAYLNQPDDLILNNFMALYHLNKSLVKRGKSGKAVKHSVIALYFLHRSQDLGGSSKWVAKGIKKLNKKLDKLIANGGPASVEEENHAAYDYFIETFNYHEENRYIAERKLYNDFVRQPNNAFTSFALTALNTWNGGEADFDDPTVLYNIVAASWFSFHTLDLAKEIQARWVEDPENNTRFRLASIIGGFTAINRSWLASLNGDDEAQERIDAEHEIWAREINLPFHSFTLGTEYFPRDKFLIALQAYLDAFDMCLSRDDLRTCPNGPRFSFNVPAMHIGLVDLLLKAGDPGMASEVLSWLPDSPGFPNFSFWDLGHDPYWHRVNNAEEISSLYTNDNPDDDPTFFFLKRKQWSTDLSTCQVCHQAQSKVWTEEEKDVITLPPEDIMMIEEWPEVTTSWYGTVQ